MDGIHAHADRQSGNKRRFGWKAPLLGGLMMASVALVSSNICLASQHSSNGSVKTHAITVSNKETLKASRQLERTSTVPHAQEDEEWTENQIGSNPFNYIAYYVKKAFRCIDRCTNHYIGRCIDGISYIVSFIHELGTKGLVWVKEGDNFFLLMPGVLLLILVKAFMFDSKFRERYPNEAKVHGWHSWKMKEWSKDCGGHSEVPYPNHIDEEYKKRLEIARNEDAEIARQLDERLKAKEAEKRMKIESRRSEKELRSVNEKISKEMREIEGKSWWRKRLNKREEGHRIG